MEILTQVQAGTFLGDAIDTITDNMPGVLVILGGAVGISIAFGLLRFGIARLTNSWKS